MAAAPLGNPGDLSQRLIAELLKADLIAAEDSRRFKRLADDLGLSISAKVISYFEGNESERLTQIERALSENKRVLLITDAGMPSISDPGYRIARLAIDRNFEFTVLPGPSAVLTALTLSGLPTERFSFEGFPPRSEVARNEFFSELALEPRTMIFFESPHRIRETLESAGKFLGQERSAAICREMTKTYEEIVRGSLAQLQEWSQSKEMLGEITVVIAGFDPEQVQVSDAEIARLVLHYESSGITRKEAIVLVARELKVAKRKVFDVMVEQK